MSTNFSVAAPDARANELFGRQQVPLSERRRPSRTRVAGRDFLSSADRQRSFHGHFQFSVEIVHRVRDTRMVHKRRYRIEAFQTDRFAAARRYRFKTIGVHYLTGGDHDPFVVVLQLRGDVPFEIFHLHAYT